MDYKVKSKMGQMAIFVIAAVAIVAVIILVFILRRNITLPSQEITDPQKFIEKCTRDATLEAVDKMMPQGGFVNPTNIKSYNGIQVPYLCLSMENEQTCISQHPVLLNEEVNEIKSYISPRLEKCFEDFKSQSAGRNEVVEYGDMSLDVSFAPGKVSVAIERNTTMTRNEETARYRDFDAIINSPLYDLTKVAIEIANQQAKYCYFEYAGYMILHPEFEISVFTFSDSTRIYTIRDKETGEKFNIAIRSCASAPVT